MPARPDSPQLKAARQLCQKLPDEPARTLARRLAEQHPKLFPSVERARHIVRYVLGTKGTRHRRNVADKSLQRAPRPAGYKPQMPQPHIEEWKPHHIAGPCRILCLSDIHVPYHDPAALNIAIATGKRHKCDTLLLNGDVPDFYSISRFVKDPSRRDAVQEVAAVAELMLYLQHATKAKRCIYKEGNHCERWDHYVWQSAPVLWELAQLRLPALLAYELGRRTGSPSLRLSDYCWEHVGDQRPVMAGKLPILHGHELPTGLASPVNPARGAFMRTMTTVLIGHGHRSSHHTEPNMWGREMSCWSQGCLCGMHPAYARVNKWNQGFAIIEVSNDCEFEVHNYRIIEGVARSS